MRTAPCVLVLLTACFSDARTALRWDRPIEVARGGGQRGPWQQNNSRYNYVDDPSVALDVRGTASVVFVDQGRKDVFLQIYERGARRFRRPVNVSRSPATFSWLPRVVVSPGSREIAVLWQEIVFSGGSHGGEIFVARSHDGGATFDEPANLSNSIGGDGKGRITEDIWHNGSLDLARSADGTLHAAWTEYDGPLWYSQAPPRGRFTAPVRIAGDAALPARAPALAVRQADVYLAWTVGERAEADIRLARSRDGGRTFDATVIVQPTPGYSDAPKLALDRLGTIHLTYAESAEGPFGRFQVRYTRSRDGGRTFERPRELSRPPLPDIASSAYPTLALDARDGVYVVWDLFPDPKRPPRGLAIAFSVDGGATFSAPAVVPNSRDPAGGGNGSHQGRTMRKLAVSHDGRIAVVNSSLLPGRQSRVWLMGGRLLR